MKKKSKKWVGIVIIILLLLLVVLWNLKGIKLNFSSYGHGDISKGGGDSLFTSLGIPSHSDVTIGGVDMCLDYDCWDRADLMYDSCIGGGELSASKVYNNIAIIPFAYAIVEPIPSTCDVDYEEMLSMECRIPCPEEVYVWDGRIISNINDFFELNYPIFYDNSESMCTSWVYGGTWVDTVNSVGCLDVRWFDTDMCSSASISSAGMVCTTVGGTFVCSEGNILCNK